MKALAPPLQEPSHRAVAGQGLEELDEGSSHRDHRLLYTLGLDHFPGQRFDAVTVPIAGDGGIEVPDRDGHMVEVEELHGDR